MTSEPAAPAIPANTRRRWLPPVATKEVAQYSGVLALATALLLLAQRFVQLRGPDTDLFPRWYGLRALLLEGRNPYDAAVTAEIASQTSVAFAPDVVRVAYGFTYPLPGALALAPLSLLPYELAATLWLTAGLIALPAAAIAMAAMARQTRRTHGVRRAPSLDGVLAALLVCASFTPALWNLVLVQPGLAVAPLVALALWQRSDRPATAGAALALAALLKPHLILPLAIGWPALHVLRAARGRAEQRPSSRRFLLGAAAAGAPLLALATALAPAWPVDALAAAAAYARVGPMATTSPALYVVLDTLLPASPARVASAILLIALIVWTLAGWRRGEVRGVMRAVVTGALVVPPAWETNAVVLLLPLSYALGGLSGRAQIRFAVASAALSLALAPLPLFLPWRSGALAAVAYAALWSFGERLTARSAAAPDVASPPGPAVPASR